MIFENCRFPFHTVYNIVSVIIAIQSIVNISIDVILGCITERHKKYTKLFNVMQDFI